VTYRVQSERQGRKNAFEADADIGGEPFENDAAGIIRFQWKGSSLAVDTLYNPGKDRQSSMEEIWTISADAKGSPTRATVSTLGTPSFRPISDLATTQPNGFVNTGASLNCWVPAELGNIASLKLYRAS
jgi:hypothetical protein